MSASGRLTDAVVAAALPALVRLRETVAAESRDIGAGIRVPYDAYSKRKNQGLLELTRLIPSLKPAAAQGALREALLSLVAELEANRRALGLQLKASAAVADIIARAIRDGQSDGTYDARPWRGQT
jgi:hypothetical protein